MANETVLFNENLRLSPSLSPDFAAPGFEREADRIIAVNGLGLTHLLRASEQWLEAHVAEINTLNVFPVPDGDTGTNMALTMRSALAYVAQAAGQSVGAIAAAAAKGALMGARGNSGVILSQFLRGLAESWPGQTAFTAADLARALTLAAERAYQGVLNPVEGTILTVARAMAEAAQQSVQNRADLVAVWADVVAAAKIAQADTPRLLLILREAGVTDAGGQGLVYILEGGLRFLRNQPLAESEFHAGLQTTSVSKVSGRQLINNSLFTTLRDHSLLEYGYDVQFLLRGDSLDVAAIRDHIAGLGESTLVVGDERLVKVHLHTADPGAPLSYAARLGVVGDVVVENLDEQINLTGLRDLSGLNETTAIIAIAPGEGLGRIFASLGVSRVLANGNPSVEELLAAVAQVKAKNVLILPNNANLILAAQQTQKLSVSQVQVIPTQTIPQGIAALVAFNREIDLETNVQRMAEAAQQTHTIEVARATRAGQFNGFTFTPDTALGFLNNELVSAGPDDQAVILAALGRVNVDAYDLLTFYVGRDSASGQAEALAAIITAYYPSLEIQIHQGGQPHYHYIISLE